MGEESKPRKFQKAIDLLADAQERLDSFDRDAALDAIEEALGELGIGIVRRSHPDERHVEAFLQDYRYFLNDWARYLNLEAELLLGRTGLVRPLPAPPLEPPGLWGRGRAR